jgi:cytochrome c556
MKLRVLFFTISSSLIIPLVHAADEAHPATPRQEEDRTELGEHMGKIGRAFRALGREVNDPTKNEDALKQVAIIRTNAEAATKLQPAKATDVSEDQKPKFLADYGEKMKGFLADVNSLEAALRANNNPEAATLVKKLKQDMDDSHKEFRKKKEKM